MILVYAWGMQVIPFCGAFWYSFFIASVLCLSIYAYTVPLRYITNTLFCYFETIIYKFVINSQKDCHASYLILHFSFLVLGTVTQSTYCFHFCTYTFMFIFVLHFFTIYPFRLWVTKYSHMKFTQVMRLGSTTSEAMTLLVKT